MEEILFWKRCKKFWKGLKTWKNREWQWLEGEGEELACICLALCADVLTWVYVRTYVVLTLLPPPCNTFFTQLQRHQFCIFSDLAVHPFSVSLSVSSSFLWPPTFGMPGDAVLCCLHLCLWCCFPESRLYIYVMTTVTFVFSVNSPPLEPFVQLPTAHLHLDGI